MLAGLGRMIAGKVSPEGPREAFGNSSVPRALGEETLRATAARRNLLRGIRDRLTSMSFEEKDELIDRLFARVALFVHDLPASESSHHSARFGLFDHLLEVAAGTVRELSAPGFQVSPEPSTNLRERPLWMYAGLVGAIAHDIGKPLDLEVAVPGKGTRWDPRAEPLRLFCLRHDLPGTGPELWHFQAGRGLRGHEGGIPALLPLVLTPEVTNYLGPRLSSVTQALTESAEWRPVGGRPHPAQDVVRVIRRVDQDQARGSVPDREISGGRSPSPSAPPEPVRIPPAAVPARPVPVVSERPPMTRGPGPDTFPAAAVPAAPIPRASLEGDLVMELPPLPSGFWSKPVPHPKVHRGDPSEREARIRLELHPERFLDTLRRLLRSRRLSRNSYYTDAYLRPDYVWFVLPDALERFAHLVHLPWDTDVYARMLRMLRTSPQVAPAAGGLAPVFMRPRNDQDISLAVRVRTKNFLEESDLRALGLHDLELQPLEGAELERILALESAA